MSNDRLQELLAKRAQLDIEIAAQRAARRRDVVEEVVRLIQEYNISARELELRCFRGDGATSSRRRVEPRYWDPKTGATWSGRGKRPRWMDGRDPEEFRLKPATEPLDPQHQAN